METFEEVLEKASKALEIGETQTALQLVTEALAQRPGHPLGENLMGLVLFAKGQFDEARDRFEGLVRRNPDVVSLRINAGLSALREDNEIRAMTHFKRAVGLDPDHRRAQAFLALLNLRQGQRYAARDLLAKAGLEELAAKAAQVPDGEEMLDLGVELESQAFHIDQDGQPTGKKEFAAHEGFAEVIPFLRPQDRAKADGAMASSGLDNEVNTAEEIDFSDADAASEPTPAPVSETLSTGPAPRPSTPVPDWALPQLTPAQGPEAEVSGAWLLLRLGDLLDKDHRRGVVLRLQNLLSYYGNLRWSQAERRRKGFNQGHLLVEGSRMMLCEGSGLLALHPGQNVKLRLMQLSDESCYLRESLLLAFSGQLYYENGRIPDMTGSGPPIIQLRGQGFVAMVSPEPLVACAVTREAPLTIRLSQLQGWVGGVHPTRVPDGEALDESIYFSCAGTGQVIVGGPAAGTRLQPSDLALEGSGAMDTPPVGIPIPMGRGDEDW